MASTPPVFEYRHTSVWAPLGGLVLGFFLLGLALTAQSVGQAILLLGAAAVCGWAATLFYEKVQLRLDSEAGELTWKRQSIRGLRRAHTERTYPLARLSMVWLESTLSSNYRVLLNVGEEWLPLSRAFTNDGSPQLEYQRLLEWLPAHGLAVRSESGSLTTGVSGKTVHVVT